MQSKKWYNGLSMYKNSSSIRCFTVYCNMSRPKHWNKIKALIKTSINNKTQHHGEHIEHGCDQFCLVQTKWAEVKADETTVKFTLEPTAPDSVCVVHVCKSLGCTKEMKEGRDHRDGTVNTDSPGRLQAAAQRTHSLLFLNISNFYGFFLCCFFLFENRNYFNQ